MPPAALRERLASLGAGPRRRTAPATQARMPRGFEPVETDFGMAWRLAEILPRGRVPGPIPPVPHGYLDTETTGLSGATGTQVFAAAVCRPVDCGLELVQLFLRRHPFTRLPTDARAQQHGLAFGQQFQHLGKLDPQRLRDRDHGLIHQGLFVAPGQCEVTEVRDRCLAYGLDTRVQTSAKKAVACYNAKKSSTCGWRTNFVTGTLLMSETVQ